MKDLPVNPSLEDAKTALFERGVPPSVIEGMTPAQIYAALGLPPPEEEDQGGPKP